jgi:hypothetical protein
VAGRGKIKRYCFAMLPLGTVAPLMVTTLSPLVAIVPPVIV